MSKRTKRSQLRKQIALLRRALLAHTTLEFANLRERALKASGGETLTLADYALCRTSIPSATWRMLNSPNEILDDLFPNPETP